MAAFYRIVLMTWALISGCLLASAQDPLPSPPTKDQVMIELLQILRENSYPITITRSGLNGKGRGKLVEAGRSSQFFLIAEEHNTQTLPLLVTGLLKELQPSGYEYLATESGTAHARWASASPQKGNKAAIFKFIHRYPYALTFYSDAEATMFADVGTISKGKGRAIWGLDQEFGAEASLEKIAAAAPSREARDYALSLLKRAHEEEASRNVPRQGTFMSVSLKASELQRLAALYESVHQQEIRWLIQNLIESNEIYGLYYQPRGNMNSAIRELYMKRIFMEEYRHAQRLDGRSPKVILKAGHWHALRGHNPNYAYTTGNMLSELAISNGSRAFVLSTYIYEPGNYMAKFEDMRVLTQVAKRYETVVIMFEPIREKIFRKEFRDHLPAAFVELVFRADAALIMGGEKHSGTTELDSAN